jgi:hypothetical protein
MHADMVEQLYTAKEEQQVGQYYRSDPTAENKMKLKERKYFTFCFNLNSYQHHAISKSPPDLQRRRSLTFLVFQDHYKLSDALSPTSYEIYSEISYSLEQKLRWSSHREDIVDS